MSEIYRAVLSPLPLLLWRTPPGLELILAQEGIAYEVVRDLHPFAFRRGRFVLFDSRLAAPGTLRAMLTHDQVALDIETLRGNDSINPFQSLVDTQEGHGSWCVRGWTLRERVSRHPKAWIRRHLISALRDRVLAAGGLWMRLASFPYPYRSAFNFRVDLDEPIPEDYHRFSLSRNLLSDCSTHFVSTHAYENAQEVLDDLRRHDTQSHGHFHYVYRDAEANLQNLRRADRILRDRGFEPTGFAAPHGRWNVGLDDAIESLGYQYSSDFQLGHDDLPFFPWKGNRFSRVLQIPVHPICEGLFLDAGARDGGIVKDHLCRVVEEKIQTGEPALVYGHPERRLSRMPEVLIALSRLIERYPLVWRTTLSEFSRWWRWRAGRRYVVIPRDKNRLEIQFEDWDAAYPLAIEVHRGSFVSSIPLSGPRTVVRTDQLVFARREEPRHPVVVPPSINERPVSLKDAVRQAIDWETVTPLEELRGTSLSGRLKKGLRWWKLQRAGAG
jgi:hypothetical protein